MFARINLIIHQYTYIFAVINLKWYCYLYLTIDYLTCNKASFTAQHG